jgi:hypothetical protein
VRRYVLILLFSFLLLFAGSAAPQSGESGDSQLRPQRNHEDLDRQREREREKRLNKERHDRIKKDTDQLLTLAAQLKEYVDKTNENVLSVQVISKAEQIEKLARSVRERMKQDYTPPPTSMR